MYINSYVFTEIQMYKWIVKYSDVFLKDYQYIYFYSKHWLLYISTFR
jgi:hypothetical protein